MLERARRKKSFDVTFVLPADQPSGTVSVVGDFNDWEPGVHTLARRSDGMRAVTVSLPVNRHMGFRYLGEGGNWFDEEGADGHDGRNSLLCT
ncbi:isoamylase early set domain-containing protein [Streptomyces sp. NPDC002004]